MIPWYLYILSNSTIKYSYIYSCLVPLPTPSARQPSSHPGNAHIPKVRSAISSVSVAHTIVYLYSPHGRHSLSDDVTSTSLPLCPLHPLYPQPPTKTPTVPQMSAEVDAEGRVRLDARAIQICHCAWIDQQWNSACSKAQSTPAPLPPPPPLTVRAVCNYIWMRLSLIRTRPMWKVVFDVLLKQWFRFNSNEWPPDFLGVGSTAGITVTASPAEPNRPKFETN